MRKLRIVAVLVAVCAVIGPGFSAAAAAPSGTTDVSVAVPMTCNGGTTPTTVNVSATLPDRVRAGRAYTVTDLTTDVANDGAATITTSGGQPATLAAGSGGSSTLQLVAPTQPGTPVTLQVTAARYLLPGQILGVPRPILIPGSVVDCSPAAPVTLGSIKVIGQGSGPATATTSIDAAVGLDTRVVDQPFLSNAAEVTASNVPTELHPGDTFSLPDLRINVPIVPFAAAAVFVVDGADPQTVTPTSVHTVTAPAGGTVELHLVSVDYGVGVLTSTPIGSGHLASIPVVAR